MSIKVTILLAGIALASNAARAGTVTVDFIHPERFTDASLDGGGGVQPVLTRIQAYLETLAAKRLKPGQTLAVAVTDIDLAGRFEPWRPVGHDVRIMRDVDPPRMVLDYRLMQDGRVQAAGRADLVDIDYLSDLPAPARQEPLAYDKALLAAWFDKLVRETPPAP
jgi:hypothetical protein